MQKQATKQDILNLKVGGLFQEFQSSFDDKPMETTIKKCGWTYLFEVKEIRQKPTGTQFILEETIPGTPRKYKTFMTINSKMNEAGVKHEHVSGYKVKRTFTIVK